MFVSEPFNSCKQPMRMIGVGIGAFASREILIGNMGLLAEWDVIFLTGRFLMFLNEKRWDDNSLNSSVLCLFFFTLYSARARPPFGSRTERRPCVRR